MHLKKTTALFTLLVSLAFADAASHRKAANDILELVAGPDMMKAGLNIGIAPMLQQLKQTGAPEAAITEIREAFNEWITTEIKWDDFKGPIADLYVATFTENELKELLAFYKSPVGQKTLKELPQLMAEGGRIGEEYAKGKQASLAARLEKIGAKYKLNGN